MTRVLTIGLVISITLSFSVFGCSSNGEKDFKNLSRDLRKLLVEMGTVKSQLKELSKERSAEKKIFGIELKERNKWIADKRAEWEQLAKQSMTFIDKHPTSPWADDAGFCLAMMYVSISQPGNDYYIEAIKAIKSFLSRFPTVHIEDWTKENFEGVPGFEMVFNKNLLFPDDPLASEPESRRIRGILTRQTVYELLKAGKLSEAKREVEVLEKESEEKGVLFGLHNDIKGYEESKRILGK